MSLVDERLIVMYDCFVRVLETKYGMDMSSVMARLMKFQPTLIDERLIVTYNCCVRVQERKDGVDMFSVMAHLLSGWHDESSAAWEFDDEDPEPSEPSSRLW
jgi:hypothetical protein